MLIKRLYCFAEIERIQKGETKKEPEKETYLDLFATKNLKLKERVLIPTKQYPRVSIFFLFIKAQTTLIFPRGLVTWADRSAMFSNS